MLIVIERYYKIMKFLVGLQLFSDKRNNVRMRSITVDNRILRLPLRYHGSMPMLTAIAVAKLKPKAKR